MLSGGVWLPPLICVRVSLIPYFFPRRQPRKYTWILSRRLGSRGGYSFGGGHVGVWWFACGPSGVGPLGSYLVVLALVGTACVHGHNVWPLGARGLLALACVLWCGVPFVFFRVALCVWGPSSPCSSHTPFWCHGGRVLCVRGTCVRRRACSLVCAGAVVVVFFPPCVVPPGSHSTLGSVVSRVTYSCFGCWLLLVASTPCCLVVCFSFSCWGAHKSLARTACTLLSVLGHATFNFAVVAALVFLVFCECPMICDLAKQRRKKFLAGFLRSVKTIFPFIFSGCASFSWFFYFFLLRSRAIVNINHQRQQILLVLCTGRRAPLPSSCGCGVRVCRPGTGPFARMPFRTLRTSRMVGGCNRGGGGSSDPGKRCLCSDRLSFGLAAGAPCLYSWCTGCAGVGDRHRPHKARSCELPLRSVGVAQGCGQARHLAPLWRASGLTHPTSHGCLSFGRAVALRCALAVGAACRHGGPALAAWLTCPFGHSAQWGW